MRYAPIIRIDYFTTNLGSVRVGRYATQSTGFLIAHMAPVRHSRRATGTSALIIRVFKPLWFARAATA